MLNIGVARQMLGRCQTLVQSAKWREAPEAIERLLARVEQLANAEKRRRVRICLIDASVSLHKARCCAALCQLYNTRDSLARIEGLWEEREKSVMRVSQWNAGLVKALDDARIGLDRAKAEIKKK